MWDRALPAPLSPSTGTSKLIITDKISPHEGSGIPHQKKGSHGWEQRAQMVKSIAAPCAHLQRVVSKRTPLPPEAFLHLPSADWLLAAAARRVCSELVLLSSGGARVENGGRKAERERWVLLPEGFC